jgi:DNA-binding NarL/FixJ family response regulator
MTRRDVDMSNSRLTPIKVMLVVRFPVERIGLERSIENSDVPMQTVASLTRIADAFPLLNDVKPDVLLFDADVSQRKTLKALKALSSMSPMKTLVLIHKDDQVLHQAIALNGGHHAVSKTRPIDDILEMIFMVHATKY